MVYAGYIGVSPLPILGIDDGKAAGGLVVCLGEPFLDEEENVAADAFAPKA